MNIGKAQYDAIPIPKELDRVIGEAVSRAERGRKRGADGW